MDVESEIQRLKAKKVEIVSRLNLTTDFNEKEELEEKLERIEKEISFLERVK